MFEIKVAAEFSGAHKLREYQGRCEKLHGHNWKVEVIVSGAKLNKTGLLIDFRKIKSQLKKIIDKLDHKYLNELDYFKKFNPTSENIAKYIYDSLRKRISALKSVTVWESSDSSARYYGK